MRYRNLFLLYSLIFLFCLSQAARAEHDGEKEAPPKTGERSTAPKEITEDMYQLLARFNPSVAYLKRRFEKTLPEGLAKSMAAKTTGDSQELRSDDDIAKDLAELIGQISDDQKSKLYDELVKLPSESGSGSCNSPDAEKRAALEALRQRVIWALDFILEKTKGQPRPKCITRGDEFKSAFEPHWKKVSAENDEFHEKMKLALAGNKEAIEFVKKKYGRDAVLGFLENHSDKGNKELANNLVQVLAEKNGQGHFIDAVSPSGEESRIVLGNDPKKFADRITELKKDPEVKGIGRFVRAEKPFEKEPKYIVPKSLKASYKVPKPTTDGSASAKKEEPETKSTGKPTTTTPESKPDTSSASSPAKSKGNELIVNNCLSCHNTDKARGDFVMNREGKYSKEQADRIIARSKDTDSPMPPKGLLSSAEQKEIENYLRATK